jgi:chemotaxis protein methyltransferase WspC
MSMSAIIELLRTRIGLEPQSLGANALPEAIAQRMRTLKVADPAAYVALLASSPPDFDELVNDVVVPETWFFRGAQLFSFLAEQVRKTTASRPTESPFRILSVPCSTGEEPYSMAIALIEAGVPCTRWVVDAVDLSARNLTRARRGLYGNFSFRDTPDAIRNRYFRPVEAGWEIDPSLKEAVRFQQGNVLDPMFLASVEPFDLIFCRNLLIYLHTAARAHVVMVLDRLLAPGGLLCTGHAEPLSLLEGRFQVIGPVANFLFRRKEEKSRTGVEKISPRGVLPPQAPRREKSTRVVEPAPLVLVDAPTDLLVLARREADAGNLVAAIASCQTQLSQAGASADLYSLMGVIHQARQDETEACACFRKALYLKPDHEEALTHLLLLHQKRGDEPSAALIRRRLTRKKAGGSP